MPKRNDIKKVLVIGSGPIVIGQAAEFDYAGTQACLALKEEGCDVVLANNNPATIMTDEQFAQTVYFEPLTVESVTEIIKKERPDGILGTLGGQTGLNLTVELYKRGILEKFDVQVLGTSPESIIKGEDRQAFRALMHQLNEPVPESEIIHTVEEAVHFAEKQGYPIIIRPAYTLGGGGGGIAANVEELLSIVKNGLDSSPISQCLIEKSIAGFKEIEFEMVRDDNDTCIAICSMENFDPVGIHTGDSIVIAPQQTLSDTEFDALYQSAVKIIRALGIVGGCNIQFAQDPHSEQYYLIEVNPRLSRSSALASKATGYPIARIAAKLSLGYHLHELINPVTGTTFASFEPVVDYTVVKMPRWAFDKFPHAKRKLGTQMKATGEIMAIDRLLPAAFQKAVRSLELKTCGLELEGLASLCDEQLWDSVLRADDRRFFSILELMRRGASGKEIHEATEIDMYFLACLEKLIQLETEAKKASLASVSPEFLRHLKENGFSDQWLANIWGATLAEVRDKRKQEKITPVFQMVDSCAGEFPAAAPYFYSTWKGEGDVVKNNTKRKIAIIGSGPVRIGQGIEFDYCTVHAALSLKKAGFKTILINNNPGTVSTDFQIADRLYFEPLHIEDVLNILEYEQPDGVIVQLGGQTAIQLAGDLERFGVPLLSISQEQIDRVEDREKFYQLLRELSIPHIPGVTAHDEGELLEKAEIIGFPVLLRPSYVIGGQGMLIIHHQEELEQYKESIQYPVLIDAYYKGIEVEVDALSDGKGIFIPAYFEHIEKAGVHSGDSITVTPPVNVDGSIQETIFSYTEKIAKKLRFKGIFNVQFVVFEGTVYVLEVNPRASRTVPIVSKITGVNLIDECINILTGSSMSVGLPRTQTFYTVKQPVFSTGKLEGVDPVPAPEMKSTGEVMAIGNTADEAMAKAVLWNEHLAGNAGQREFFIDDCKDKEKWIEMIRNFGFSAVTETEDRPFSEWIKQQKGGIFVSPGRLGQSVEKRKMASLAHIAVVTEMETLEAWLSGLKQERTKPASLQDWLKHHKKEVVT
jgi:carbamoyl-phosphate synthase large subunit